MLAWCLQVCLSARLETLKEPPAAAAAENAAGGAAAPSRLRLQLLGDTRGGLLSGPAGGGGATGSAGGGEAAWPFGSRTHAPLSFTRSLR